jgi:hypothetical protein
VSSIGKRYGALALGVLLGYVSQVSLAANADSEPLHEVADLRYGVVLYHYYQERHVEALSELMVAEERGGIQGHSDNPELIAGAIRMTFGMQRAASEAFRELLSKDRPVSVRNAAWYYLSKLQYLHGQKEQSLESMSRIEGEMEYEVLSDVVLLELHLAIQHGQLDRAKALLLNARYFDEHLPLALFNMASALSRDGRFNEALGYYQALTALLNDPDYATQPEFLALYDKALTAAGYSQFMAGDYERAMEFFEQVRLDSDFSNRALLGLGWAAMESGDVQRAIGPWQILSQRSRHDAAVQESALALGYAHEKNQAYGAALAAYQHAEQLMADELEQVETLKNVADVRHLSDLAQRQISEEQRGAGNWLVASDFGSMTPDSAYLLKLYSRNDFLVTLQQIRDLAGLKNNLSEWQHKLEGYNEMLALRGERRLIREKGIQQQKFAEQLQQLQQQRDALNLELRRIIDEQDYLALATYSDEEGLIADQLEMVGDIGDALAILQQPSAASPTSADELTEYLQRYRFYRGRLLWDSANSFDDHLWQLKKQLRTLDELLATFQQDQQRLSTELVQAPDITPYDARLQDLSQRVAQQLKQTDASLNQAEKHLETRVKKSLEQRQIRLKNQLAQARLSIARLYDAALSGDAE